MDNSSLMSSISWELDPRLEASEAPTSEERAVLKLGRSLGERSPPLRFHKVSLDFRQLVITGGHLCLPLQVDRTWQLQSRDKAYPPREESCAEQRWSDQLFTSLRSAAET